jgi:cation diffusion facilitator CzcD-associated flavoprotein CzcO
MTVGASYSKIACVGTGVSAIGLGATLKRWYDEGDIIFFERSKQPGGTWNINQYPGMDMDSPPSFTLLRAD